MTRVWDALVRSLHWLLAASALVAWVSGHWLGRWFEEIHHTAGYVAAAAIAVRVAWGFAGGRYARFTQFVRGPRVVWAYARQLLAGREPRHLGHNPLGGVMVLALLGCVAGLGVSGWMFTTDAFWGDPVVSGVHAVLAWALLALVVLHLAGVVFTSRRHRENLVRAMVDGNKPAAGPEDIV